VPQTSPVRPIARLASELSVTGVGQLALGLAVLAVALSSSDIEPARAVVPFVVTFVALGGLSIYQSRWLKAAATPPADPEARVEEPSLTTRRSLIGLLPAIIAIAVATLVGPGLGVVLGGVVAGVGVIDLRNRAWVREREGQLRGELYRELGGSPFSSGKRPLYTLPRIDSTLAT